MSLSYIVLEKEIETNIDAVFDAIVNHLVTQKTKRIYVSDKETAEIINNRSSESKELEIIINSNLQEKKQKETLEQFNKRVWEAYRQIKFYDAEKNKIIITSKKTTESMMTYISGGKVDESSKIYTLEAYNNLKRRGVIWEPNNDERNVGKSTDFFESNGMTREVLRETLNEYELSASYFAKKIRKSTISVRNFLKGEQIMPKTFEAVKEGINSFRQRSTPKTTRKEIEKITTEGVNYAQFIRETDGTPLTSLLPYPTLYRFMKGYKVTPKIHTIIKGRLEHYVTTVSKKN